MVWHNLNAGHEGKYKCVANVEDEELVEIVELKVHSKLFFAALGVHLIFRISKIPSNEPRLALRNRLDCASSVFGFRARKSRY